MKKLLLATAIAALSVSAANAAPTVYGKAFLTLDLQDGDTDITTTVGNTSTKTSTDLDDRSQLNSNSSRVGFKGSEALTANTDLVYQLEYGIDVDAGESYYMDGNNERQSSKKDQFYARDTYIGLANKQFGTVVAGRLSAIDGEVDYANVTQGGVIGGDNVLASFDAERANNAFAYFSPSYDGMQFMAMYAMDENKNSIDGDEDTFNRDAFGIGGKYEAGPMNIGATYIYAGDASKIARISGNYMINPAITVGALYQNHDFDTDDNENAFTLSGELATQTPWTHYGQVDYVTNVGGSKDSDKMRVVAGTKYAFSKATTGHIYGAYQNSEDEAGNTKIETDSYGLGAGLEYKF